MSLRIRRRLLPAAAGLASMASVPAVVLAANESMKTGLAVRV